MLNIGIQFFGGRGGGGSGGARGGGRAGGGKSEEKAAEQKTVEASANTAPKKSPPKRTNRPQQSQSQTYTLESAKAIAHNAPVGTKFVNDKGTVYIKQSWDAWSVTAADGRALTGVYNDAMAKRMTKGSWKRSKASQTGLFGNWV